MRTYTTLKVLKNAYRILSEIGLSELLAGGGFEFDAGKLANSLLLENKLNEFLEVITADATTDFDEMTLKEVVDIVGDFFIAIKKSFPESMFTKLTMTMPKVAKEISS